MNQTRAILLTDVVDSTQLSVALGDKAMVDVWTAHDRLARDLLPAWRGREIDKTDGMLLLFDSARDAVHYALAYHQALAEMPVALKARAGLHVGPILLRENSAADVALGAKPLEAHGLAKPTAARVMSLANGGQTLLTAEARRALGDSRCALRSHGHWMLKGLADPMEIFEAAADEDAFSEPAQGDKAYQVTWVRDQWLPVREIANNLPQQTTSFVGRERELREISAALRASRLVTLLGMGGLGKTRLSLRVAAEAMVQFPDGIWFLDLAPIRDPALVIGEAAQMLGVREESGHSLVHTLSAALKPRQMLLILDNCEHLIDASAQLAHEILRAAPQVRILATSREALRVPGEQSYPVLPLPVPSHSDTFEALLRSSAVRLFVERAQSHDPGFALTEREAPAVAWLVAGLEGIPLALELAAARVRALSVSDICARLKDRYKLLTGGDRVLLQRQQTLRALVDWSYDLLSEPERTVLNRAAVFVGGFDLAAAEQVCGAEPLQLVDVLDVVTSLVEKSLMMAHASENGTRYRMLETIRDYGREKLTEAGNLASSAVRHCQHYFSFTKSVRDGLRGPEQRTWLARMEADFDNVRAGIDLALAGGIDPIIAGKYAVAMQGFWTLRGYTHEGRSTIRAVLKLAPVQESPLAHGHALYVGAALAYDQSDYAEARTMLERCLTLRTALGNPIDIAATLSTLSLTRLATGDPEAARESDEEALAIFRERGERVGEVIVQLHLGQIHAWIGEDAQARMHLDSCLSVARQLGHRETEAECELTIGQVEFECGALNRAGERFHRSMTICHEGGDKRGEANAQWWLAKMDLTSRDIESASNRLCAAVRAFRDFGLHRELMGCLEDHARLALAQGRICDAVRLVAAVAHNVNLLRPPRSERRWQAQIDSLRAAIPRGAFQADWDEGQTWSVDQAVRLAISKSGGSAVLP